MLSLETDKKEDIKMVLVVPAESRHTGPMKALFGGTPLIWAGAKEPTESEQAVLGRMVGEEYLVLHRPAELENLYDLAQFNHQFGSHGEGLVVLPESEIPLKCGLAAMNTHSMFWFMVSHTVARPDGSFGIAAVYQVENGYIHRIFSAPDPMSDEGETIEVDFNWSISGPFGPSQL